MKSIISIVMTVVLLLSVLTGCGTKTDEAKTSVTATPGTAATTRPMETAIPDANAPGVTENGTARGDAESDLTGDDGMVRDGTMADDGMMEDDTLAGAVGDIAGDVKNDLENGLGANNGANNNTGADMTGKNTANGTGMNNTGR